MKIGFAFDGGEEVARALSALAERASKSVQREALLEGGEVMRGGIAAAAPRRPPLPDLADHIVISRLNQTDERAGGVAIGPYKPFFYGGFLEFGTSRMAAHPFMRPGFDATVGRTLGVVGQALWRELAARGVQRSGSSPMRPSGPGRTV